MDCYARGAAPRYPQTPLPGNRENSVGIWCRKVDALELFHPDRLVSLIMCMGDYVADQKRRRIDKKSAMESPREKRSADSYPRRLSLTLRQVRKLGALDRFWECYPASGHSRDLQKVKSHEKE